MTIASYSDLKSSIADWLNRQDLTAVIPSFIALAESQFNTEERLRNQKSIVRADATLDSQYAALPLDYLEMLNLSIITSPPSKKMQFLTLNQADDFRMDFTAPGKPNYYTIVGNQMEFLPIPDTAYAGEMVYYAKIPSLSDDFPTNWLLNYHPEVYLYGALIQAAPYLKDDDRIATWTAMYNNSLENIHQQDDRALFAGAVLQVRTKAF